MGHGAAAKKTAIAPWPLFLTLIIAPGCRSVLSVLQPPTHIVVTAQFKLPARVGGWPELQWVKINEACVHPEGPYELPHPIVSPIDGFDMTWAHLVPMYRTHPAR